MIREAKKKSSDIPIEQPVPLTDEETEEKFNRAVKKAGLLYEKVELSSRFQFGILSNKEFGEEKHDLIYTSVIDRDVHILPVDCTSIKEMLPEEDVYVATSSNKAIPWKIKEGFYLTSKNVKGELRFGVTAHNGRTVASPVHKNLVDVLENFIVLFDDINGMKNVAIDYNGTKRLTVRGEPLIYHTGLTIDNEPAALMTISKWSAMRVFVFYKDNVYAMFNNTYFMKSDVMIENNKIYFRWPGGTKTVSEDELRSLVASWPLSIDTIID